MQALKPHPQTHTPPAKAWRNFYRVYHVLNLARLGYIFPGIQAGPDLFASRDIAETHAREFVAAINPPGRWYMEFVGAFPEGERPN